MIGIDVSSIRRDDRPLIYGV